MNAALKTLLAAGAAFAALSAAPASAQTYPQCARPAEINAQSPVWSRLCRLQQNSATVDQRGGNNGAAIVQTGRANAAEVLQRGIGNVARTQQNGYGNRSSIRQIGSNNEANVIQNGDGNVARVIQVGDGHQTEVIQNGGERSVILQTPAGSWSRELPNVRGQIRQRLLSGAERRYVGDLR